MQKLNKEYFTKHKYFVPNNYTLQQQSSKKQK